MTKRQKMLLNQAETQHKEHYKMYKSGAAWAFTCITLLSGIIWAAPTVSAKADTTTTPTNKVIGSAGVNSGTQTATTNSAAQSSATTTATSNAATSAATQNTASQSATTQNAASPSTTSQAKPATDVAVKTATPASSTNNVANSTNVNTNNVTKNTTAAATNNVANAATTHAVTANSNTAVTPSAQVPVANTAATPTNNQITTANLNGSNPANMQADGTISKDDKTNTQVNTVDGVDANFKAMQIVKNADGSTTPKDVTSSINNGGVTLTPAKTSTVAGTLVYKNQIDTTQAFTFNATLTSQAASHGGGIGFILQPVDPQKAGIGDGSDPSADIGIYGQPNTTFIGRDGYPDTTSTPDRADTQWNQLTVRQTDAAGHLTTTSPTWASAQKSNVPLTEYVTLAWQPTTTNSDNTVTGTLTYTTYSDAARTMKFQSVATTANTATKASGLPAVTLNKSVSIAAFAAVGQLDVANKNDSDQRSVSIIDPSGKGNTNSGGFSAKVNTMPVKFAYIENDDGKQTAIHSQDVTNVNVGDTINIGKTTDLTTNTFAPRVIDGYQFVKAVTSQGGNSLSVNNSVLNALTQNDQANTINIYYTNQVNYTIQPVDAQGNAIVGLAPQQVKSQIGSQVAAPAQDGYLAATITAPTTDGTIVKAVYTANKGSVQVSYAGLPANITPTAVTANGTVGGTYQVSTPVIAGYTADLAAVEGTYVQGATPLTVHYTASNNSYQVIPVDGTGKAIATLPTTTETSKTDTNIAAPTYAGYTLADKTMPTTQAGVNSYQLHYTANSYQVSVNYTGLPANLTQTQATSTGTTGQVYQVSSPVIAGYTPDQASVMGTYGPVTAADGTFTVHYTADTKVYKVQAVDGNGNPIATLASQQYDGKTGDTIDYPTYAGYTVSKNDETVPAEAHPKPTINVKYVPNASRLTVQYAGLPTGITPATQTQSGVTDGAYQVTAPTIAGYTPDSTVLTGTYSNTGNLTKTITYTANDNSYTITPVDENGKVIAGLSLTSGTTKTDAAITAPDYSADGYLQDPSQSQLITKAGVTNYQVHYTTNAQTITVNYTGLSTAPAAQTQIVKIGNDYSLVSPTITGYTPDQAIITGTYQNKGQINFTVNYAPINVTVTVQHTGLDSTTAGTDTPQTVTGKYGTTFSVNAADIAGYTPDQKTITGTFSADNAANMYAIKYTGKPATVTVNFKGADSQTPQSMTLTGVVGGTYSLTPQGLTDYTPDQAKVSGMFTAANANDSKTNQPVTVNYVLNNSLRTYTIVPVDVNNNQITGVTGLASVTAHAKAGTTVDTPDYTNLGYVAAQPDVTVADTATQTFKVLYQRQVAYAMQAVDANDQPISSRPIINATGIVGSTITPTVIEGYNAVSKTYTVPQTATTNANPLQIQYVPKDVTVTVVPVDGNGNVIANLAPRTITQAGGTQLDEATLTQTGYQVKAHNTIAVPISDTGISTTMAYLKEVTLGLSGSDAETYSGGTQNVKPAQYSVTLPDGSSYALNASDVELTSGAASVQNAGTYQVQLTASGKAAITAALAQNYVVSFDDAQTGSLVVAPKALTAAAANTALVPANATNATQNPQLATSIVVQGSTKTYDNNAATDTPTFNVLAPSQYTDFTVPTDLTASDFNTTAISQNAGSYQVTLNASGLSKLQAANTNYSFDMSDVQNGLFVINPRAITITAPTYTKTYDGTAGAANVQADTQVTGLTDVKLTDANQPIFTTTSINGDINAGSYALTVTPDKTVPANQNYVISTVAGQLTINKATLTTAAANTTDAPVNADDPANNPQQDQFIVIQGNTKVYDGQTNTDPAMFTVLAPSKAAHFVVPTLTADDFDMTGITGQNVGNYAVKLSATGLAALQQANANYQITAANVQTGLFVIAPNAVSQVSVNGTQKTYDGQSASYSVNLSNGLTAPTWNAADFTVTANGTQETSSAVNAGNYTVTLSAQGLHDLQAVNQNYQLTNNNLQTGTFTIDKAPVTITAPQGLTKVYDGKGYAVADAATVTGQPANGDAVKYQLSSLTDAVNAGSYALNVIGTDDNPNYAVTVVPGTFTVTKNDQAAVTLGTATKVYDNNATTTPAVYGVTLPAGVIAPTWTAADFELSSNSQDVGTYAVQLSAQGLQDLNDANGNYSFKATNVHAGSFSITPAAITVTAPTLTKVYDGTAYSGDYQAQVTGVPADATAPKFDLTDLSQAVNAKTYELNATLKNLNKNYTITYNPGQLTISQAPITIAAPTLTKAYDGKGYAGNGNVATVSGLPTAAKADALHYSMTDLSQMSDVKAGGYGIDIALGDNPNYAITTKAGTLTITPMTDAAVNIAGASKTYDGAAANYSVTLPDGVKAPAAGWTAADFNLTAPTNAGTYTVTLSATGIADLQAVNSNYQFTGDNVQAGNFTIAQAPATATVASATKVYDNNSATNPKEYTVHLTTGDLVLPSADFNVATATNGQNVGSYAVTLNADGLAAIQAAQPNYSLASANVTAGSLDVTPANVTLTAPTNATKVYDGKAFSTNPTALVTVSDVPANGTPVKFAVNDLSQALNVGKYDMTITPTDNPNYTFTINDGSFTITPQTATASAVQVANAQKTYDGNATTDPQTYGLTANSQYAGLVIPATLTADDFNTDGVTSQNVGSYAVTLKQSGIDKINAANVNYVLDTNSITGGQLTINKRAVTITAKDAEKTFDGKQYSDPVGVTPTNTVDTGAKLVYTVNVPTGVNAATTPITVTANAADNPNYEITTANGKLTITPEQLTANAVTFSNSSKVYNGNAATDLATYTLQGPADDNNFTVPTDWTAADFDNSGITSQNVGNYQVQLSQAGLAKLQQANRNYIFDMSSVQAGSFAITKAPLTVTLPTLTKTYDGQAYSGKDNQAVVDGVPAGVAQPTFELSDISQQVNVGTLPIMAKITSADAGNYTVTYTNAGQLTITKRDVTISGVNVAKTYDGTAYTDDLTPTITNAVAGDEPVYTMTSVANDLNAGAYDLMITANAAENPNYNASVSNGKLTINKAPITITAPTLTKTYDGSGYAVSDSAATVTGKPANGTDVKYHLSSLADAVNAGPYALNVIGTDDNPNYTVSVVPSTFTVTKNTQVTVTLGTATKVYDGNATTTPKLYTVTLPAGVVAPKWTADDFELSSASQNVGSYDVQLSAQGIQDLNTANKNYSFTAANAKAGSFSITPASLEAGSIAVQDQAKIYDGTAATDSTQYAVTLSNQLTAPKWTADDFDLSGINSQNVGSYAVTLSAKGIADLQAANTNYKVSATDVTGGHQVISQAPITITAPTLTKTYDGSGYTVSDSAATVIGKPANGADVQYHLSSLADVANAGSYALNVIGADDNPNYEVTTKAGSLTITQAPLEAGSIAVQDQAKTYDGTATTDPTQYAVTLSNQLTMPKWTADDFDLSGISSQNAGSYAVTLSAKGIADLQAANANYKVSATDVTGGFQVINKAPITITAPSLTKTYDGKAYSGNDDVATVAGFPTDGTALNYSLTDLSQAVNVKDGGYTVAVVLGDNPNYDVTTTAGSLTINPMKPQFRFFVDAVYQTYNGNATDNSTVYPVRVEGGELTQPQWTASDFVRTGTSNNVGSYEVTLSDAGWQKLQAANPNFVVTPSADNVVPGNLVIQPATLKQADLGSITVSDQTKVYDGDATTDPKGYAVDLSAGLTTPSWTGTDFTRQDTNEDAGSYAVSLSQAGLDKLQQSNPNFTITSAGITAGHLTITPAAVTITAPSGISKTADGQPYTGNAKATLTGVPAKGTPVNYQLNYGTNGNVGVHPVLVAFDAALNHNYTITTVPGSYTIVARPAVQTVTTNPVKPQLTAQVKLTPIAAIVYLSQHVRVLTSQMLHTIMNFGFINQAKLNGPSKKTAKKVTKETAKKSAKKTTKKTTQKHHKQKTRLTVKKHQHKA
ncbi:MBG domain-containing protein [Secundilactobacillus hailunensis]|uniref:MBG domain-containing protein n=1 Tax=Secundilactobacillus hailunensis TaxID=2559923 RepID=A0ABW1TB81_9LACO|nr:MBG domain-containing protein [Secundilactobacillus hailunensis]